MLLKTIQDLLNIMNNVKSLEVQVPVQKRLPKKGEKSFELIFKIVSSLVKAGARTFELNLF